jgi:GNAT superfamily N-acetyltransferase
MNTPFTIRQLHSLSDHDLNSLTDILIDCVTGGASVSFMHPLTRERALAYWRQIAADVHARKRALLIAEDNLGPCGTVQLNFDLPENQPHRADLCKMLVHRRARRRGIGAALLQAAEQTARDAGKTLLVLDAVTSADGARLYQKHGWTKVGDIPNYALMPNGFACSTTYFYRALH